MALRVSVNNRNIIIFTNINEY